VALASVCISFIDIFVSQGLGFAIIQKKDLSDQHLNTAFWIQFGLGSIIAGFVVVFSSAIANVMGEPRIGAVLKWLAFSLLISSLVRIQVALLTKKMRFDTLALRNLIASIIGSAVGITTAFMGFGVWSLVWKQLVEAVIGTLILWSVSGWHPRLQFSWSHFKDLYSYGIKVTADSIFLFGYRRVDDLFIGTFLGPTALGYFSIAKQCVSIIQDTILNPIDAILLPLFSKMQNDTNQLLDTVRSVIRYSMAVAVPLLAIIAAFSTDALSLIFGEKWVPAAIATSVLSVAAIFGISASVIHSTFHSVGKPGIPLISNIVRGILSSIVYYVVMSYGINGIAGGVLLCSFVIAMVDTWFFTKHFGLASVSIVFNDIIVFTSVVLVIVFVVTLGGNVAMRSISHWLKCIIEIATIGFGYLVYMFFFRRTMVVMVLDTTRSILSKINIIPWPKSEF
jgi:PST family polysaccharide transporter